MRTITIKHAEVKKAFERAADISSDWQAELCELLLTPKIAKRFSELNIGRLGLKVERHDGEPHKDQQPEDNLKIGERKGWASYAGYTLVLFECMEGKLAWNSVREDYYGHAPSTCWDGVRRETIHQFLEAIRMLYYGHNHPEYHRVLTAAGVRYAYPN